MQNDIFFVIPTYRIKGSIELWPTLVEIAFFEKARHGLPELRVANQRA